MALGERIRARLDALGMSVVDLATELEAAGAPVTTRQAVHRWIAGDRKPDPANLVALVQVLHIPAPERREWVSDAGYGEIAGMLLGAAAGEGS